MCITMPEKHKHDMLRHFGCSRFGGLSFNRNAYSCKYLKYNFVSIFKYWINFVLNFQYVFNIGSNCDIWCFWIFTKRRLKFFWQLLPLFNFHVICQIWCPDNNSKEAPQIEIIMGTHVQHHNIQVMLEVGFKTYCFRIVVDRLRIIQWLEKSFSILVLHTGNQICLKSYGPV